MRLYFPKLQWKYSVPTGAPPGAGNLLSCFLIITSLIGCLEWWYKNEMGCRGQRVEVQAPAIGRAQSDLPSPLSWKLLWNLSVVQLHFLSCFVLVLYMFSMAQVLLVQQPDTISPAQDHPVTGLAALRLLESLKKGDICSWGSGEPGLGLLPVGFEEETSPSRWCLWWLNCMLAFGVRGNRQSLHHVSAVAADLYQQPLLFTSCGGSPDVHICTWCSSDFGWVKKSRKGFNLSTCGH